MRHVPDAETKLSVSISGCEIVRCYFREEESRRLVANELTERSRSTQEAHRKPSEM
jgi:hypothetical protein